MVGALGWYEADGLGEETEGANVDALGGMRGWIVGYVHTSGVWAKKSIVVSVSVWSTSRDDAVHDRRRRRGLSKR